MQQVQVAMFYKNVKPAGAALIIFYIYNQGLRTSTRRRRTRSSAGSRGSSSFRDRGSIRPSTAETHCIRCRTRRG